MFKRCTLISIILVFGFVAAKVIALPDPIVYYTFDENGDPKDASGNGNDGVIKGDIKLIDEGKVEKCFEFNGANSYVELPDVCNETFTHMCWISTTETAPGDGMQAYDGNGLIWSDVGGPTNDYASAICGNKFAFFVGSPNETIRSSSDVTTGEWIHVAATRDMGTGHVELYVNGVKEAEMDHSNMSPLSDNPIIAIGANPLDSRYYMGLIDEVKLFNVALTGEQIQQTMLPAAVEPSGKLTTTWARTKLVFLR